LVLRAHATTRRETTSPARGERRGGSDPAASERRGGSLFLPTRSSGLDPAAGLLLEKKARATLSEIRRRDFDGPPATGILARAFVRETLLHSHDVATLSRALGVAASKHDLEELRPIDEVRQLLEAMNAGEIEGIPAGGAPGWLSRMIAHAERGGQKAIDVGKLNPYVAAGLAITRTPREQGPDSVAALALHRLAEHHVKRGPEMAADIVNSIRMPRIYRPQAMSFEAARAIAHAIGERDGWTAAQMDLLDRAVDLQESLERSGQITSYLGVEQRLTGDGWNDPDLKGGRR
jgi:hypothetical protein